MASSVIRLSTDASRDLTGLAGGSDGRLAYIHNVGAQNLVLKDESASSSAANRFALNGDYTVAGDTSVILQYDSTSARWRLFGQQATSGSSPPFDDATAIVKGSGDATKLLRFEVDGLTTGTTRVLTPQDASYTIENTGHASKHVSGGSDSIKLDDLAAPDDNTDLNASTLAHGLVKKLSGSAADFYNGAGNWAVPSGVSDGDKGDITVSSSGTVYTIDNGVVTFAKMQAISADVLLGNDSSGTTVQEITCTSFIRTVLDDASATDVRNTIGAAPTTPIGVMVQKARTDTGTANSGSTAAVMDDTIMQNTEGVEFITQAITPTAIGNLIHVRAQIYCTPSVAAFIIASLFIDTTANALVSTPAFDTTATGGSPLTLDYWYTAVDTSAHTFKVRAGLDRAGTVTFNGSSGSRYLGGVMNSFLECIEYKQ